MFVLLWRVCKKVERVCTHVRLVILEMSFCVYVSVVVEGMYTCKNGHFGNKPLCLCLCSSI